VRPNLLVAGLGSLIAGLLLVGAGAGAAAAAAPPQPVSTILPEPVYAGAPADGARAALAAPRPGSGGWYWPVGAETFSGWSGWLAPRGAYVHVAQDMPCAYGRPVYAVADGVVFISRADAGGYGVGGSNGGCVIITHTTAAGKKFHALYGHVYSLRFKAGQRVKAGDVIARVNGCRHLHFSVHPGTKYRDGNPYAGHVPKSWADHGGFVDPVRFLKTNPSAAAYRPPALPRTDIVTGAPPLQYGAADDAAYWTEEGGAGSVTYRHDLTTGERIALGPGEVAPPFDEVRYDTALLAAPAVGLSVRDHLPAVTLTTRHATPVWGASARLRAVLTNAKGAALRGAIVRLERLRGDSWLEVRLGVADGEGRASWAYRPYRRTTLRVTFTPPSTQPALRTYLPASSRTLVVTPHVLLTTPLLRATVVRDAPVTVAGYLTPRHPAGGSSVVLVFQRRGAGGAWVTKLTIEAQNRDAGSRTRYVRSPRLPLAGTWRVRAEHPADDAHARSVSGWRPFVVR